MAKLNSNSPTDILLKGILEITKQLRYRRFRSKKEAMANIDFIEDNVRALDKITIGERKK